MDDPLSRRGYIGTLGSIGAVALAGCSGLVDDEDDDEADSGDGDPEFHPSSLDTRDRTFRVGPDGGGIDFEPLVDIAGDHTPEGLAYRNGHFYTGQREGPAWVREYTVDGELTGERFEFDDVMVNHTNTMDWVNGELWVSDSNTQATYCIDWEEKEIVQEIHHSDPAPGTWRAVVPTKTGEKKLLFCEWLGRRAWIVDLEGAREDGSTGDHFEKTLRNGFWTNPQTMEWIDGDLFVTTHEWIIKCQLPYADQLPSGYPVTSYEIEWAFEFEDHVLLEQMVYNPDRDEYYLIDRGRGGMIYVGKEGYGEYRNQSFAGWDTTEGGLRGERVVDLNEDRMAQLKFTQGSGEAKVGWVDVSFKPVAPETEAGAGIMTPTNDVYTLGVWESVSADTVAWFDGEEWTATEIELPTDGWMKFGYDVREESVTAYVSTTRGQSWTEAAAVTDESITMDRLWLEQESGHARAGHWNIDLKTAGEV